MSLFSRASPTFLTLDGLALRLPNQTPGLELIIMYNLSLPSPLWPQAFVPGKLFWASSPPLGALARKSLPERPAASDFCLVCKPVGREGQSFFTHEEPGSHFHHLPMLPLITAGARLVSRPLLLVQMLLASDFQLMRFQSLGSVSFWGREQLRSHYHQAWN